MAEFPIDSNDRRAQYSASGGQTAFPYDFPIFAESEITVYRTRAGATSTLALATDYAVSGVGAEAGGNVTLAAGALAGDVITILGTMPNARTTDFQEQGDFRAEVINRELDRLTIQIQELRSKLGRAVRQPDSDGADIAALPAQAGRATKVLGFDADGDPVASTLSLVQIESGPADAAASAAAAAASAGAAAASASDAAGDAADAAASAVAAAASAASISLPLGIASGGHGGTTADTGIANLLAGATQRTPALDTRLAARTAAPAGGYVTVAELLDFFVGAVFDHGGSSLPTGFLWAAGQNVSRTTYAALFAKYGTTHGAGDGSTTFGLPDLRGRVTAGRDDMNGSAASRVTSGVSGINGASLGAAGGDQRQQSHTHGGDAGGSGSFGPSNVTSGGGILVVQSNGGAGTANTGSAGAGSSQNMQPTMIMNKIIFAGV